MDSDYLKEHVGTALSQGLVELVQKQPVDPIDFLAGWLRKYVENMKEKAKDDEDHIQLTKEQEIAAEETRRQEAMLEEQKLIAEQQAIQEANNKVSESKIEDQSMIPADESLEDGAPSITVSDVEPTITQHSEIILSSAAESSSAQEQVTETTTDTVPREPVPVETYPEITLNLAGNDSPAGATMDEAMDTEQESNEEQGFKMETDDRLTEQGDNQVNNGPDSEMLANSQSGGDSVGGVEQESQVNDGGNSDQSVDRSENDTSQVTNDD